MTRRQHALLPVLALAALVAGPAAAQDAARNAIGSADAAAIRLAVQSQLDAFARDDAADAYRFAAPNIRQHFPTPDAFMAMVRHAYRPVYRPRSVEFGAPERRNGTVVQEVELVGPDNRPVLAAYTMEPDNRGGWLITGCVLLPSVRAAT